MNANCAISMKYDHRLTIAAGLGTNIDHLNRAVNESWTNGTGAAQVNHGWHDKRTLAHGATDTLDLSDLAGLESAWAEDIQFDLIKGLLIQNLSSTPTDPIPADTITVATGGPNAWDSWFVGTMIVRGGMSVMYVVDKDDTVGMVVTAASKDKLRITASVDAGSGSLDYVIALIGVNNP